MPYKDPEKKREYDRKRRETHKQQIARSKREWAVKNRDKVRQRSRDRYHADPAYFAAIYARQDPVKRKARRAITNRVRDGKMPHASFFTCADCTRPAEQYHHETYESWWAVTALCKPCHDRRHLQDHSLLPP